MYVHDSNVVYIAHPKTASQSVGEALQRAGWKLRGTHHEIVEEYINADTKVLSAVREPHDLYVSWYYHHGARKGFHEWLMEYLDNPNKAIKDGDFFALERTTHILFFDTIQESVNAALIDVGLDPIEMLRTHDAGRNGRPWQDVFSPGSMILFNERKSDLINMYEMLKVIRKGRLFLLTGDGNPPGPLRQFVRTICKRARLKSKIIRPWQVR